MLLNFLKIKGTIALVIALLIITIYIFYNIDKKPDNTKFINVSPIVKYTNKKGEHYNCIKINEDKFYTCFIITNI
jgi:hypothetical protein